MFLRLHILAVALLALGCSAPRPIDQLREIRRVAGPPATSEQALTALPAQALPPGGTEVELSREAPRIHLPRPVEAGAIAAYPFTAAHGIELEGGVAALTFEAVAGQRYLVDIVSEADTSDLHVVDPAVLARDAQGRTVPLLRLETSVHRPTLAENARVRLTALLAPLEPGPHRLYLVADVRGVEAERAWRSVDRGLGGDVPVRLPVAPVGTVRATLHRAPDLVTLLVSADRLTTLADVVQEGEVPPDALPAMPPPARADLFRLLRDRLFGFFARQQPAPPAAGAATVALAATETPQCHAACRPIADCDAPLRHATFAACTIACDSGKAARELACVAAATPCTQAFACFPRPAP